MKICLLASEFYPIYGGIGRFFTDMCKTFKDKKEKLIIFNRTYRGKNIFDVLEYTKIFVLRDLLSLFKKRKHILYFLNSIWKILTAKNLKIYFKLSMLLYLFIKPKVLTSLLKNLSTIYPLVKKINPDLIYGSACDTVVMPLGFILSKFLGIKFICSAHGTDFLVRTRLSLKTYYLKAIDKIIVSSNRIKKLIKKINHLNDNQLTIIPYGLFLQDHEIKQNIPQIKNELHINPKDFILISVGRHAPRKNFQLVIKAMKFLKKTYPYAQIKYFLIGSGQETEKLKIMTNNLGLKNEVIFLGAVNDTMKKKYLKASDVFIMPSIATKKSIEGFGIVYLEANYFKLPVIGTISGGILEAIEDRKSGLLIKPNDLNGLINAIVYLYENEEERKRMGEYGYNRVINKYNWEFLANEYIKVFENIIKEQLKINLF
ncbi:D-inositol-3-phosphate glycosyltransferase [subsurface metagenome]